MSGTLSTLFGIKSIKNNLTASSAPTITDDKSEGYQVLSTWIVDESTVYLCTDNTVGAAVWVDLTDANDLYQGAWAASTNTPTLTDGTGDNGDFYIASDAGTVDFGAGDIDFTAGDQVIYNGLIWQKIEGGVDYLPLDPANNLSDVDDANTSLNNLLPDQAGNSGKFLETDGSSALWVTPTTGTVSDYVSESFTTQTSVTVSHSFGAYPVINIIDSAGDLIIPISINHSSTNAFTVTFSEAKSGVIIASVGSPALLSTVDVIAAHQMSDSENIVNCTGSASFTVTLPDIASASTNSKIIKNSGTGTITVLGDADIDGEPSVELESGLYPRGNISVAPNAANTEWLITT